MFQVDGTLCVCVCARVCAYVHVSESTHTVGHCQIWSKSIFTHLTITSLKFDKANVFPISSTPLCALSLTSQHLIIYTEDMLMFPGRYVVQLDMNQTQ